ncbi:TPA: hypothetical protein ACGIRW_004546, partial [Shigella sonnei]
IISVVAVSFVADKAPPVAPSGRFFLRLFFVNAFGNVPASNKKQPNSTLKIFILPYINNLNWW